MPALFIIGVSAMCGIVLMPILFGLYWFRYLYMSGYYKVYFYDEDMHRDAKLIRLKNARQFDAKINGQDHTFSVRHDKRYTEGMFKLNIFHYVVGDKEPKEITKRLEMYGEHAGWHRHLRGGILPVDPINIEPMSDDDNDRDSREFHRVAHNRVTAQLLEAFDEHMISPTVAMLILGAVMVIGFVALGAFNNHNTEKLIEAYQATPVPSRIIDPGVVPTQISGIR